MLIIYFKNIKFDPRFGWLLYFAVLMTRKLLIMLKIHSFFFLRQNYNNALIFIFQLRKLLYDTDILILHYILLIYLQIFFYIHNSIILQ